jgi:hypothetical protein
MYYDISWWARVEYRDRVERFFKQHPANPTFETRSNIFEQALRIAEHLLKS